MEPALVAFYDTRPRWIRRNM